MKKLITILLSFATAVTMFAGCDKEEVFRLIKVNSFEGEVTVEREEKTDVFEGMQLISEDSVEIGEASLLELLADSDKHIVAEENTAFKLRSTGTETSGNITIDLLYGKSLFTIDNKLPDGSTFEVNTPNASLSVRGTTFYVAYDAEKEITTAEVIEGKVLVTYEGGEEIVEIDETIKIYEADGEVKVETFTDTAAVVTTAATTPEESNDVPAEENQNLGNIFIQRTYQLTEDDSYKTLEADYYSIGTGQAYIGTELVNTNTILGIPNEYTFYSEMEYMPENPYLSTTLNELKPYMEAHVDEINEFFEKNKNEEIRKNKDNLTEVKISEAIDWFPDTVTIKNDTGTYVLNVTSQTLWLSISGSPVEYSPSTSSLISDYYTTTNEDGTEWMYHCNAVGASLTGYVEFISQEGTPIVTTDPAESDSLLVYDNSIMSLARNYQLTGDNSYELLAADYYDISVPNYICKTLGVPELHSTYSERFSSTENLCLEKLLDTFKPYTEANIAEINDFFTKNKNEVVNRYREGEDNWCISKAVDFFPETITVKLETGTYALNISQAIMSIPMTGSYNDNNINNYISDYFVGTGYNGETTWNHACSVSFTLYGTVEKIS